MIDGDRIRLARERRRLTQGQLAARAGISQPRLSQIEKGESASDDVVHALAEVLGYPISFFQAGPLDEISADTISFRARSRMSAPVRKATLGAATLGELADQWLRRHFDVPSPNVPDIENTGGTPAESAQAVRASWKMGWQPVPNMVHLLESHGVRVLSLGEDTKQVDAFSFWRDGKPFIFLNQEKSAERSRFDAAHELGHLVMHRQVPLDEDIRRREGEADSFASEFLIPTPDLQASGLFNPTPPQMIEAKARWGVSTVALAFRLHKENMLSDWAYKQICVRYRSSEPGPARPHETSQIWDKVLRHLRADGLTLGDVAAEMSLPKDELSRLLFGLALAPLDGAEEPSASPRPILTVLEGGKGP